MPKRRSNSTTQAIEDIRQELAEIRSILIRYEVTADKVANLSEIIEGNGKPGFQFVRDTVLEWRSRFGAIVVALIIQALLTFLSLTK